MQKKKLLNPNQKVWKETLELNLHYKEHKESLLAHALGSFKLNVFGSNRDVFNFHGVDDTKEK